MKAIQNVGNEDDIPSYKEKVERLFQNGKPKDAWQGVKTLAGLPASSSPSGLPAEVSFRMAEELNNFYCRFDQCDYTQEREELSSELLSIQTTDNLQLQPEDVELILRRTKPSKAPGPDQICGCLLKVCSSQLAGVLCSLFNRSLAEHSIPSIWKSSIICPVAKKSNPTTNNDYRPVALTSLVMKSFERLVMAQLQVDVGVHSDPLQFTYRPQRGVDDAVLTLLHGAISHLEKPKSHASLVFVDFSSAFNTLQPHLMGCKLLQMNANPHLILWVLSFLTERDQRVRVNGHLSTVRTISTGSQQGSVISPLLFTLYTNDCRSTTPGITYIKYSDDTVIMDTTNTDGLLQTELDSFSLWCKDNCLDLNHFGQGRLTVKMDEQCSERSKRERERERERERDRKEREKREKRERERGKRERERKREKREREREKREILLSRFNLTGTRETILTVSFRNTLGDALTDSLITALTF
ncbi:hypothetical protein WMY93_011689 [Mugilogobius chulae]|uniref:Reverse transcriptase domain-containing protein n=1 Tax=Mugilogobius chulae TaxID=88201 RepID=A0AAW0P3A5_9GOBI